MTDGGLDAIVTENGAQLLLFVALIILRVSSVVDMERARLSDAFRLACAGWLGL